MVPKKKIKTILSLRRVFNFFPELLVLTGFLILALTFGYPLFYELEFRFHQLFPQKYRIIQLNGVGKEEKEEPGLREIVPLSFDFGIVIPKINANAEIFPNVDPYNEKEFLPILRKGVAHAKGTSFPGHGQNIYLFAHSTDAFYNVGRYNAVFYLIGKLEKEDEVDIFYKNKLFKYLVFEKKVVPPEAIQYLEETNEEILTLQTCYPPGTTLRRLVVRARPEKQANIRQYLTKSYNLRYK